MRLHKACVVLAFSLGFSAGSYAQSTESVVKLPNEIEFKAPLRPGGPAAAVLYGDPTKPGLYVMRVKFEPGLRILPHWHPEQRTAVVLSGTFHFGLGEQWDDGKLKVYPAGTFFSEPPQTPHFAWAKDGEVILQITGIGPTGTTTIPQKQ